MSGSIVTANDWPIKPMHKEYEFFSFERNFVLFIF